MVEATITKATVVQDEKTLKPVLMGVAQYGDDFVNFKMEYDWESLDIPWFLEELRDNLAQAFDIPVYRVDIQKNKLLKRMELGYKWLQAGSNA